MKFKGIVNSGDGRGRDLGFPTANLSVPDLEDGIYVGLANEKPSLIFIGAAITFDATERKAEIYILDGNENLYGKELEIEILKKLRDNIKFATKEELIAQMNEDVKVARNFFKQKL